MRCSAWARAEDLSPLATIGGYEGYVLVETPLPWPRDVSEIPALGAVGAAAGTGVRVQAVIAPSANTAAAERQVIYHAPGERPGWFSGYLRSSARGADPEAVASELIARHRGPRDDTVDVLVCTHGRRDVCCGSLGTELALALDRLPLADGVRVHRTSHTGGHRFAPTVIVLPQGTAWAFADPALVVSVLERSVPFSSVSSHYRGCSGLVDPAAQALERSVLDKVGWELLDTPRRGFATGESGPAASGRGRVARLETIDGSAWEGVVGPGRTLPVPDCGRPLSEARKSETEMVVSDVRAL